MLETVGLRPYVPKGAYYVMCDFSSLPFSSDLTFARHLVEKIGVAAVPGSSFFRSRSEGAHLIRFCFAKRNETLAAAEARLANLTPA